MQLNHRKAEQTNLRQIAERRLDAKNEAKKGSKGPVEASFPR